jgi:hypothetical protein
MGDDETAQSEKHIDSEISVREDGRTASDRSVMEGGDGQSGDATQQVESVKTLGYERCTHQEDILCTDVKI